MPRLLELFSGTKSISKVLEKKGYEIISLVLDNKYKPTINEDILNWDYKKYPSNYFDLITASPVCLYWSVLRNTWIGRKCKSIHPTEIITMEHINKVIDDKGKPMIDKTIEIINYFKNGNSNLKFWIENPQTGKLKTYMKDKYPDIKFNDFDYCKFSNWGYKKRTRFWSNIEGLEDKLCKKDCDNIIISETQKLHKSRIGTGKTVKIGDKLIRCNTKELREKYKNHANINNTTNIKNNRDDRYRIPEKLITYLISKI